MQEYNTAGFELNRLQKCSGEEYVSPNISQVNSTAAMQYSLLLQFSHNHSMKLVTAISSCLPAINHLACGNGTRTEPVSTKLLTPTIFSSATHV